MVRCKKCGEKKEYMHQCKAEKPKLPVDNVVSAVHIPGFKDMSRETQDAIIALVAAVEKEFYEKGRKDEQREATEEIAKNYISRR